MANPCESFWEPGAIGEAIGGRWLFEPASLDKKLTGVGIDTRTLCEGAVFVAIKGDRFDGHDFLGQAVACGAGLVVVSDCLKGQRLGASGIGVLWVEDTVRALGDMARCYRVRLGENGTKVIAVTGSNGKTTTRDLIHGVLSSVYAGSQSIKNYNNHIGVPLTLLGVKSEDEFVVVEIGSSGPGEISALGELVGPDVAVITNIGVAHLEAFGSLEGVAGEKSSLLGHVCSGGVVVPGDEPLLDSCVEGLGDRVSVWRFGSGADNDLQLIGCEQNQKGWGFEVAAKGAPIDERIGRFRIPLLGKHNIFNAMAAVCVGRRLGVSDALIAEALERANGVGMRLSVSRLGSRDRGLVVVNDAYNASPESVVAAIETLIVFPLLGAGGLDSSLNPAARGGGGRRVLVLGDMLELGLDGPRLHREVGQRLAMAEQEIDRVILIGCLSGYVAGALEGVWPAGRVHTFAHLDEAVLNSVADLIRPCDVVLLKASRGVGLEGLIPYLERKVSAWCGEGAVV